MTLSYIYTIGNKSDTFDSKGIITDCLPYRANLNTTPQYLQPDYFLSASQRDSYYSRKYGKSISRISRIVSASLLSAMVLTATLDAKAHPSVESSILEANPSFLFGNSFAGISTNVPLPPIMPQSPLSAPPTPPSPPVLPAMPDFIGDVVIGGKSDNRSVLFESIRNFGKNILKKVKKEPKPKVVPSDGGDLMSQLSETLERRRRGISGEKDSAKSKKVVKQAPKLTAEEIARKKAENLARAATIREQNKKQWEEAAKKNEEIARERRRVEAEAVKARIEQKAKERAENREGVVMGIDPALHNNIVADLRQEIRDLKEQLTVKSNETAEVMCDLGSSNHARGKRSLDNDQIVETKDQSTSTEDLTVLEDRLYDDKLESWEFAEDEARGKLDEVISTYSDSDSGYDDEALEDSSIASSISSSDTNSVASEAALQSEPIVSEMIQEELMDVEKELESQSLVEEEVIEAVEDILDQDIVTDTRGSTVEANSNTVGHQEELTKRAKLAALAREDLRFGSKAVSKQIRHRLSAREIGSMVAVSAGDEEESQALSYSVWSSGVFGGSKQKDSNTILGYSSRIRGGSIGGEINLSNDLMFGASLSRLHSTFKYLPMLNSNQNQRKTNTNIFSIYSSSTLVDNINLQTLASVALSGKHGKKQDISRPKSKLFSFESHLNQKIRFQNNITVIPSIGFRYEYGRVGASRDIIRDSYVLHHKKSKNSTLSGEIGTRVLFTPIKLSNDFQLVPTAHISLEKRIGGSVSKSGQLLNIKDIGGQAGNANHEKLSTNIGSGLIASHKHISLEFLYDLQKQRSFKSHQGVLKLKVNL